MKQNKYFRAFDEGFVNFPMKEGDLIAFVRDKFDRVPNEHRENARANIEAMDCHGDVNITMSITYARLETDAEEAERERLEAFSVKTTEQRERELLASLLEKYPEGEAR